MPYIQEDHKAELALGNPPITPGELNYLISKLMLRYLLKKGISYQTINDIVGALESAKMEFYRRVVVPYEEEKIKENGDVY